MAGPSDTLGSPWPPLTNTPMTATDDLIRLKSPQNQNHGNPTNDNNEKSSFHIQNWKGNFMALLKSPMFYDLYEAMSSLGITTGSVRDHADREDLRNDQF
jgi:hypothetical protein